MTNSLKGEPDKTENLSANKEILLNRFWRPIFRKILVASIFLFILFSIIRVIGIFGLKEFKFILPFGFIIMAVSPFIFLNQRGRSLIGFNSIGRFNDYLKAIIGGSLCAFVCSLSGILLFGTSYDNWFITIKNSYLNTFDTSQMSLFQIYLAFTIPAIIFSPIGEEIFFRGFLQESLNTKFNYWMAMIISSLCFGLIHLFHHGIVQIEGQIKFLAISGFIWFLLIFGTAVMFAFLRKQSKSIYPPIVAHIFFNLMMNFCIFYWLKS